MGFRERSFLFFVPTVFIFYVQNSVKAPPGGGQLYCNTDLDNKRMVFVIVSAVYFLLVELLSVKHKVERLSLNRWWHLFGWISELIALWLEMYFRFYLFPPLIIFYMGVQLYRYDHRNQAFQASHWGWQLCVTVQHRCFAVITNETARQCCYALL